MSAKQPPDITDPDFLTFMSSAPFRWQGDTGAQNWLLDLYELGYNDGAGSGQPAPAPVLNSITPNAANVGDPSFQLVALGSNFQSDGVIVFGGVPLPTSFNAPTQLTGQVDASLITNPQSVNVSVQNPDNQLSGIQTFTIS